MQNLWHGSDPVDPYFDLGKVELKIVLFLIQDNASTSEKYEKNCFYWSLMILRTRTLEVKEQSQKFMSQWSVPIVLQKEPNIISSC